MARKDRFVLELADLVKGGEKSLALAYVGGLAKALRDDPSPEECAAAAELLERAVEAHRKELARLPQVSQHEKKKKKNYLAVALYLTPSNRPTEGMFRAEVYRRINVLLDDMELHAACQRVARELKKSVGSVKAIFSKYSKAEAEGRKAWD